MPDEEFLRPEFAVLVRNYADTAFQYVEENVMAVEAEANQEPPETAFAGQADYGDQLRITAVGLSAPNVLHRERNEDRIGRSANNRLYVVLDGMGGHPGSHVAAYIARRIILDCLAEQPLIMDPATAYRLVDDVLMAANSAVAYYNRKRGIYTGATCALVWQYLTPSGAEDVPPEPHMIAASVGDARVLAWYPGQDELFHATIDQNQVRGWNEAKQKHYANLPTNHKLGWFERREFDQLYKVSNALGHPSYSRGFIRDYTLQPGARLLICSDGPTDMLSDPELAAALAQHHDLADAPEAMLAAFDERNRQEYYIDTDKQGKSTIRHKEGVIRGKYDDFSVIIAVLFLLRNRVTNGPVTARSA